jgi:hypothetical protein
MVPTNKLSTTKALSVVNAMKNPTATSGCAEGDTQSKSKNLGGSESERRV